jgi:hypothetical protein
MIGVVLASTLPASTGRDNAALGVETAAGPGKLSSPSIAAKTAAALDGSEGFVAAA